MYYNSVVIYSLCVYLGIIPLLYFSDPLIHIGRFSWLILFALIVETLIVIKFGWDIVTIPIPPVFLIEWALLFIALSIWAVWKFTVPVKEMPFIRQYFSQKKEN